MQNPLENHPYIQELIQLDKQFEDRMDFHKQCEPLLLKMGQDKDFLKAVIKRNFDDEGFLKQQWTGYNIPFFYVHETEHYNLKIHLFPPDKNGQTNIAAHCIHHHNNYLLTTNAFFGSGYETFLFERNPVVNADTLEANLKIAKHFHQKDWNPSRVNSWEPHVVIIPESFSATILIWTPDKKRSTDNLRQNPLLKSIKQPLRWLIHKLGLTRQFGIAEETTYQFYPNPQGKGYKAIEENDYFAPTKAEKGDAVNAYSAQMIFAFIQRCGLLDKDYFNSIKAQVPSYYQQWIDKVVNNEQIADVYHRTEINIPQKTYYKEDILKLG
ncbi:MAG: hypothetical protein V4613_10435 [Bacteroidota bacterium]